MAYEFKNLNAVDMIAETSESTTVLGIHEENVVQIPAGNMGSGGGAGLLFEITEEDIEENSGSKIVTKNYDPIYETLLKGGSVVFKISPAILSINAEMSIFCMLSSCKLEQGWGFTAFFAYSSSHEQFEFPNGSYHG